MGKPGRSPTFWSAIIGPGGRSARADVSWRSDVSSWQRVRSKPQRWRYWGHAAEWEHGGSNEDTREPKRGSVMTKLSSETAGGGAAAAAESKAAESHCTSFPPRPTTSRHRIVLPGRSDLGSRSTRPVQPVQRRKWVRPLPPRASRLAEADRVGSTRRGASDQPPLQPPVSSTLNLLDRRPTRCSDHRRQQWEKVRTARQAAPSALPRLGLVLAEPAPFLPARIRSSTCRPSTPRCRRHCCRRPTSTPGCSRTRRTRRPSPLKTALTRERSPRARSPPRQRTRPHSAATGHTPRSEARCS